MSQFKGDETKVIHLIEQRLRLGEQRYGALDVHDKRDKVQEALEEALDMAVYLATKLVALTEEGQRAPKGVSTQCICNEYETCPVCLG